MADSAHVHRAPHDRRLESVRLAAFARTRESIAQRLTPVCGCFPAEEFEALVTRATIIALKYQLRRDRYLDS